MWIARKRDGTIAGGQGSPQMEGNAPALGDWANGKLANPEALRLLPVDDNGETYLAPQEWISDAAYAEWKAARVAEAEARPNPPTVEERLKALEDKLALAQPTAEATQ